MSTVTGTKRAASTATADTAASAAKKAKSVVAAKKDTPGTPTGAPVAVPPTTTMANAPTNVAPVGIVMDDENGDPLTQSQITGQPSASSSSNPAAVVAAAVASAMASGAVATITKQVISGPVPVQKVNWRYLAQGDNFARLVTVSDMGKSEGCYVNFDARKYERETGERFTNKATRNALTIEGPWMKCVTGLHDSAEYPGSYSMMLSIDCYDADEDVGDFVEFMERVFDGHFIKVIQERAFGWMKKDMNKYGNHVVVQQHKDTTSKIYQKAWQEGTYTQDQYEAEVKNCIKPSIRSISKDGTGAMMLNLKVYPVKEGNVNAVPVRPDIIICDSRDPPNVVPYAGCKIAEKGATFVKPIITISRISFAKEKFHITPVTRLVRFKTIDELDNEKAGAGGQPEMSFSFDGQNKPVMIPVERRNAETGGAHDE